jgi:hypothetical protein
MGTRKTGYPARPWETTRPRTFRGSPKAFLVLSEGFAPRTPLHALSRATAPARAARVARSLRSLASLNGRCFMRLLLLFLVKSFPCLFMSGRLTDKIAHPGDEFTARLHRVATRESGRQFEYRDGVAGFVRGAHPHGV